MLNQHCLPKSRGDHARTVQARSPVSMMSVERHREVCRNAVYLRTVVRNGIRKVYVQRSIPRTGASAE
jgi:hypothetical protein